MSRLVDIEPYENCRIVLNAEDEGVRCRDLPTANLAEVKRGKWIIDEDGVVICSECGEEHTWDDFRPPYCDMCGARMDGDAK